MNGRRTDRERA